jgi:hypothetical protein
MAEYTEQDSERASGIVDNLLAEERRGEERRFDGFPEGFSVVDVQAHADEFLDDSEVLRLIGADFPAMEVAGGPPSPVSLAWLLSLPWPRIGRWRASRLWPGYVETIYDAFHSTEGRFRDLPRISREQARANFFSRARDSLATRLSALRRPRGRRRKPLKALNLHQYAGGPLTKVAGCQFSVITNTPGLRAFWSGAYYISPTYHGAPTSPAVGVLQAGTYVFGIDGGAYGNQVQWDTNAVCTLPGNPSVHLQY